MSIFIKISFIFFVFCVFGTIQFSDHDVGIIGGHEVTIEEVPFMASLRVKGLYHICGASIIHRRFVLTAAHCIDKNKSYKIAVGTDSIHETGDLYEIRKIIVHKEYDNVTYHNDICLIKLNEPIKFGIAIKKIKLYDDNNDLQKGTMLAVTGWGFTKPNGPASEKLQQVSVPVVTNDYCNKAYEKYEEVNVTQRMLCAGGNGRDSCQGDSGGPLTMNRVQVGIVSNGAVCGKQPGVYTKVASYLQWIRKRVKFDE